MTLIGQVVMAVARVFFYLAPSSQLDKVVSPLLRLLPLSKEIERVVLANLIILIQESPVRANSFLLVIGSWSTDTFTL